MKIVCLLFVAVLSAGCSTFPSTQFQLNAGQERPPFRGRVLTYMEQVPPNVEYEVIGDFVEQGQWYGSTTAMEQDTARTAAEKGANGILIEDSGHRPTGWSWASPFTEGKLLWIQNYQSAASSADSSP